MDVCVVTSGNRWKYCRYGSTVDGSQWKSVSIWKFVEVNGSPWKSKWIFVEVGGNTWKLVEVYGILKLLEFCEYCESLWKSMQARGNGSRWTLIEAPGSL